MSQDMDTVSINMPLGCLRFQGKNRLSPRVWPGVSRTCISCSPNIQIWPSLSAKSIPGIRSSSALGPTTYPTDIAFITQDNLEHFKFKVLIKRTPELLNLYSIWRERPDRRAEYKQGDRTFALYFFLSSAFPPVWSQWWCVLRMYVRERPLLFRASITGPAAEGSTTPVTPEALSWSKYA